jgi:hypothetical protein
MEDPQTEPRLHALKGGKKVVLVPIEGARTNQEFALLKSASSPHFVSLDI